MKLNEFQVMLWGIVKRAERIVVLFMSRGSLEEWKEVWGPLYRLGELLAMEDADETRVIKAEYWKLEVDDPAFLRHDPTAYQDALNMAEEWLWEKGMLNHASRLWPERIKRLGLYNGELTNGELVQVFIVDCGRPGENLAQPVGESA